jgi:CRISPR-associated protein (TIGR03986 family)
MLKAPFNFVPLSPTGPFIPNWSDQVSQDLPFSDGLSGKITLNITAETEIFVRNGSVAGDASFSHVGDRYFVPGTSIKGAIRSVFEIVTFGKMTQFNHDSFAFRDLTPHSPDADRYKNLLHEGVFAGWMVMRDEKYYLYLCSDDPIDLRRDRITAQEIDAELGRGDHAFERFIHEQANFTSDSNRTAKKKYEMLFDASGTAFNRRSNYIYVMQHGDHRGMCLVLTGQPGVRDDQRRRGKGKDFLFPAPPMDDSGNILWDLDDESWEELSDLEMEPFKSIHKNSPDYVEFWSKVLRKGGAVPVFYIYDAENKTYNIGLTYMFKYPAKQTVESAIPEAYRTQNRDMAELLFGYTSTEDSLKGRLHVGHAFVSGTPRVAQQRTYVMSSPNSTYYPLYLKRKQAAVSWNSSADVEVAGFKRYPTRASVELQDVRGISEKMHTHVTPLMPGTQMQCELTFHNLKPAEFGALWYTLTALKYYQIGGLKPYGYGKVSITPTVAWRNKAAQENACVDAFKSLIAEHIGPDWEASDVIRELKAMAAGVHPGNEAQFTYMHMDNNRTRNEFLQGKNAYGQGERFQPFTDINQKH